MTTDPSFWHCWLMQRSAKLWLNTKIEARASGFATSRRGSHTSGREIEVVNQAENSTEDLLADLTSIIYSFCARLYGQRRAKRKTEKIVQELEDKDATG